MVIDVNYGYYLFYYYHDICGLVHIFNFFFFFSSRRRHTRYWRDWSSDVCSSDLRPRDRNVARLSDEDDWVWPRTCCAPRSRTVITTSAVVLPPLRSSTVTLAV